MKINILLLFLLISSISLFSQDSDIDDFLIQIRNENFEFAEKKLHQLKFNTPNCKEIYELEFFVYLSKNKGVRKKETENLKTYKPTNCSHNIYIKTIAKLNFALYNYYYTKNSDFSVITIYLDALKSLENTNYTILKGAIIRRILEYHNDIFIIKDFSYKHYTSLYKKLATDKTDTQIADFYNISIEIKNTDIGLSKANFKLANDLIDDLKIGSFNNKLLIIAGNYIEEFEKKEDALNYYEKSLAQIKNDSLGINIIAILGSKLNLAIYHYYNNELEKAFNELKIINNYKGKLVDRKKIYFDYWLSLTYEKNKDFENAYKSLKTSRRSQFSFNQSNHLLAIRDLQIKYESEKKEKENLQLKIDQEKNRNLLIASVLFIFLGGTIATLTIKNSRKKTKVAQQQKELEKQKNITFLKEQEITTINAMVNGQEKERKQIAEDLHDNLGSVLATLKLHFENLKINNHQKKIDQDILFGKTEKLIDEAYLKVRSIAHAKNAGVIANQGLLIAIKMMAEKISTADKIKIDVVDFGLNKRLENTLEITVFRVIQELITNIIKHAEATNATINISFYENNLNIIVEDNGKGFKFKKVDFKKGMGLSSIKIRIKHLKGTFNIDSTLGKGSSIIINIPTH